jgi:CTP:molybdopterin cytidylyltransferase MocA
MDALLRMSTGMVDAEAAGSLQAIVLAAGESRRFGSRKLLACIDGVTLLERAVRTVASVVQPADVIVVLGADREALADLVRPIGVRTVWNGEFAEGIGASIRCGVGALSPKAAGVLICLADQPAISAVDLQELVGAWQARRDARVAAAYGSVNGPPVIFPRRDFAALRALRGDVGARKVLALPDATVVAIPMPGAAIDIDTTRDLANYDVEQRRHDGHRGPPAGVDVMKIRLLPAGREFEAAPGEAVLQAALRAGLNLPHSCRGGSCGSCRARLVAGSIDYVHGPPQGLGPDEAAQGFVLLCQARARSDLVIEADEVQRAAEVQLHNLPCRVQQLVALSPELMGVWLRLPAVEPLGAVVGQYVDLLLPAAGIASRQRIAAIGPGGNSIEVQILRESGDALAAAVFAHWKPGTLLRVAGPFEDPVAADR